MFFLTHDERNGKPRITLEVLGVGLAGAAMAELALSGDIYVEPQTGQVTRVATSLPDDAACRYVLEQIYDLEPERYTATDWIMVLRDDLYQGVANSLQADNMVKVERSPLSRANRYVPIPRSLGEEPLAWVFGVLRSRFVDTFEPIKQVLTCLVVSMGSATAVCAISAEEVERTYPEILRSCDEQTVAIGKATAQVKRKLSMKIARR